MLATFNPAGKIPVKWLEGEAPVTYDAANRLLTALQSAEVTGVTQSPQGNLTGEQGASGVKRYLYYTENRLTWDIYDGPCQRM